MVDFIDIIRYDVGDEVTIEYKEGERSNTVLSLNGEGKAIPANEEESPQQEDDTSDGEEA